ncbi:hypothetical protein AB0H83_29315 [Dactylosporangium sp. NPDC050688]|uniref:hypothetical protein n=1 Tax=Dactylosporangium sp. NPDC050688 TaxID=3157217 RepID=UPI0033F19434
MDWRRARRALCALAVLAVGAVAAPASPAAVAGPSSTDPAVGTPTSVAGDYDQHERFVVRADPRRTPWLTEIVVVRPYVNTHHAFNATGLRRG